MSEALSRLEAQRGGHPAAIGSLEDMRPGIYFWERPRAVASLLVFAASAAREIVEFRRFQQLSDELVEVSEQIYRVVCGEDRLMPQERRLKRSNRKRGAR